MSKFLYWLAIVVAVGVVMDWLQPYDDSDDVATHSRSGLAIRKDHLTGCEYFAAMFGPPIPRMDASGKQICRKTS